MKKFFSTMLFIVAAGSIATNEPRALNSGCQSSSEGGFGGCSAFCVGGYGSGGDCTVSSQGVYCSCYCTLNCEPTCSCGSAIADL
jgi:hypothetical protein